MRKKKLTVEQQIKYVQDTLFVTGGKWKLPVLIALHKGKKHFKEIQKSVPPITSRVLSKELKELELNKLITRTVYDTFPVTIEYKATLYCETLRVLIEEMVKWGENHRQEIKKN